MSGTSARRPAGGRPRKCGTCGRGMRHCSRRAAPWDAWFPRLFALADEALASRAELARLDAALAAAAHLGRCWAALCRCTDEFLPDYPDACAEHEQALYGAVEAVIAATGAGREEG
jgi:hypothetical protein